MAVDPCTEPGEPQVSPPEKAGRGTAVKTKCPGFRVIAMQDYQGDAEQGCLPFAEGDELEVLRWNKIGWWYGRHAGNRGGTLGWLPSPYLRPAIVAELSEQTGIAQEMAEAHNSAQPTASPPMCWPPLPPANIGKRLQPTSTGTPVWPPLPSEPPPENQQEQGAASGSPSTPVWPPLPSGPPPENQQEQGAASGSPNTPVWPPLPPGLPPVDQHERSSGSIDDYSQELGIHPNGRIGAAGQQEHFACRQMQHFFDYQSWIDAKNTQAKQRREGKARLTKDGGMKRKLGKK